MKTILVKSVYGYKKCEYVNPDLNAMMGCYVRKNLIDPITIPKVCLLLKVIESQYRNAFVQ
jgi:hypothetical protein